MIQIKIAVFGDWHGSPNYACSAISLARHQGADVALHVGDFGYNLIPYFLDKLDKELAKSNMKLYWVDGNHENFDVLYSYPLDDQGFRPLREHIIHCPRGKVWVWNDKRFLAMGGAVSVDKDQRMHGTEWWPEEAITFDDIAKGIEAGYADVMICHDVPDGVHIEAIQGNPFGFPEHSLRAAQSNREALRAIVDEVQPGIIFSGHYHSRESRILRGKGYISQVEILDCDGKRFEDNMAMLEI